MGTVGASVGVLATSGAGHDGHVGGSIDPTSGTASTGLLTTSGLEAMGGKVHDHWRGYWGQGGVGATGGKLRRRRQWQTYMMGAIVETRVGAVSGRHNGMGAMARGVRRHVGRGAEEGRGGGSRRDVVERTRGAGGQ
jgi:hypothetical protein